MENLPSCIWFEGGDKKNAISSLIAGLLVILREYSCFSLIS